MNFIRRTFVTVAVFACSAALALFAVTLVLAACSEKISLRFETNGGTPLAAVEGRAGERYAPPSEPEKEGYYFDGWYLSEDLSGERQELPEVLPEESVTYFAKYARYPVLTLDPAEGILNRTEHLVKPGVPLTDYLEDFKPVKSGLVFGSWLLDGEPIGPQARMPDGDLKLTARYKALFSVDIYLQNADSPSKFERSTEYSRSGADWEGETLTVELPEIAHFLLDEGKTAVYSRVLRAGDNTLAFYFTREEFDLKVCPLPPLGGGEETTIHTRYGAHLSIPSPAAPEGYEFFGWSHSEGGPAEEAPSGIYEAKGPLTLYGAWARVYSAVRGSGKLSVAEYERDGVRRAVYTAEDGTRSDGEYRSESEEFRAGDYAGRLDGHGGFLPDDTGDYAGYGLLESGANAEKYGALTLDFGHGSAVYALDGARHEGTYEYLYDEAAGGYTGEYVFTELTRGGERFLFRLGDGVFLREGAEKGEYGGYDLMEDAFAEGEKLILDGFGAAVYRSGGVSYEGVYRGSGKLAGEWEFEGGEIRFRFFVGGRIWRGEDPCAEEAAYLRYRADRAGSYVAGNETLVLDGYGLSAVYTAGGERTEARYVLSDGFVTLLGERETRFTLKEGGGFALTGAEAGTYVGERGALRLDGASGASLVPEEGAALPGKYVREGSDWEFTAGTGERFLFRLKDGRYSVYREALYGQYEGYYGTRLTLDGFGGGSYTDFEGKQLPIGVGYWDGENFEILSPSLREPLYFRISGGKAELVQSRYAGVRYRFEGGERTDEMIYFDGKGGAARYRAGVLVEKGSYVSAGDETDFFGGSGGMRLLFTEAGGVRGYIVKAGAGSYSSAEGMLTLDGYGGGTFAGASGEERGTYVLTEAGAELSLGGRTLIFALSEGTIESLAEYEVYRGAAGVLLLGKDALLRTDSGEVRGTWSAGAVNRFEGEPSFSFLLRGEEYYLYDGGQAGEFTISSGGTLRLDGCGFGTYVLGVAVIEGSARREGERVVFCSERLSGYTRSLAFVLSDGILLPLGAEYGEYAASGEGGTLTLFGDGRARIFWEGALQDGRYTSAGADEFDLVLGSGTSLRVRVGRDETGAVYSVRREALAALGGTYASGTEILTVDAYGLTLNGEALGFICADGAQIIARNGRGETVALTLSDGAFALAEAHGRFELRPDPENFTET